MRLGPLCNLAVAERLRGGELGVARPVLPERDGGNKSHLVLRATPSFAKGQRQDRGGQPLSYNKSADFYAGVSKVLASKPDTILVGGPSEPTVLVIKQARELGYQGGFMISPTRPSLTRSGASRKIAMS